MYWQIHHGDLLDVTADVLVCSANVFLTLSGGVGGAFLLRYGSAMQTALQDHLVESKIQHVERGDVIVMPPCGSPYRAVLHAVAVNGVYESSPEIVSSVITKSLQQAAALSARSVALAAVGTGYGRLSMKEFAQGLHGLIGQSFPPLERIVLALRSRYDVEELHALLPQVAMI